MRNLTDPKINFSGRGLLYTEEEIAAVAGAMRNADPLTQGRHQREFEAKFGACLGAEHCFAVHSCTAALELAATLSGIGPGDEVIIPAHTYCASAIPFARRGARLVWADIDRATRLATAETIAPLITPRTKLLVVVHLYGLVSDMDPIMALAREHGLMVVEDVAQAVGGAYKGRKAGTIGDFGCFSFHSHKNISTLGEGGMLVVKDPGLAKLVPGLRHNGHSGFAEERAFYWQPAMSNVDVDIEGVWPFNYCIGEVQCALGTLMLDRLDAINGERAARGAYMLEALKDVPELSFQATPAGCDHTWHLLAAWFDPDGRIPGGRDRFIEQMAFGHGIKVIVQYYPLYRYPLFAKNGMGEADCPVTDAYYDSMVSFPFMPWLSRGEMDAMAEAARSAAEAARHG